MTTQTGSNKIGHPTNIGILHFVGIGGIGMSGIAEVMHNFGYKIQGSDISENANVKRLRDLGIKVFVGQREENLEGAWGIVISTAIQPDNPEVIAARANKMPLIRRSEMLAELMRLKWCISVAGTHGKTTTTTMVSAVLDEANYDPTVINGGIINAYGTNARLGDGDWMVVEADESDGTFIKIPSTVAVVTNIDPEHLDFYGDFENAKAAFKTFIENVPFYGFAAMCIDHPEVQTLIGKIIDRRIVTYGFSPQAKVRGKNVSFSEGSAVFDVEITNRHDDTITTFDKIEMPMPGRHNVLNALAAIAVSHELGIANEVIRSTFSKFSGVKRRFTLVDKVDEITIVDDYAHHPIEIDAVFDAVKEMHPNKKVLAVFQPHLFSRTRDFGDEFAKSLSRFDNVLLLDIYPARENPISGIDSEWLVGKMTNANTKIVGKLNLSDEIKGQNPEVLITMGAGDIGLEIERIKNELTYENELE